MDVHQPACGGYGEFPITKTDNFSFTAKIMAGVINVKFPYIKGSSFTDTTSTTVEQFGATTFVFAYSLSAGLKYQLSYRTYLLADAAFMATPKIVKQISEGITIFRNSGPDSSESILSVTGNEKQSISSLNLNLGIGFTL